MNSMFKVFVAISLLILPSRIVLAQAIEYRVTADARERTWAEQNVKNFAQRLKDPQSAIFEDVYVSRKMGPPVTCGLVNARNSFGAFNGFQRFVAAGQLNILESEMASGEMDAVWNRAC